MDTLGFFRGMVAAQKKGSAVGVCSICSAHPLVVEAALAHAQRAGGPVRGYPFGQSAVLIESTVNQVNQLGGYTGMTPRDFRAFIESGAASAGFPPDRIILGGDHLGPYPWRTRPSGEAMSLAHGLVAACVRAGYSKIHLDASMPLCGDPVDGAGGLDPRLAAQREAELAQTAETAFREYAGSHPDACPPVYVIGTEVPAPGGMGSGHEGTDVTDPREFLQTVSLCEEAFRSRGLAGAWDRVIACVAQPGVEYADRSVHRYNRALAEPLCRTARSTRGLVIEGHSTDYQSAASLRELVEDGIAILKVGPALTFAMRECLFGLELIERELVPPHGGRRLSLLAETLDRAMLENPEHWKSYYAGSEEQEQLSRKYSFSDRSRYYWAVPAVQKSLGVLMANLRAIEIPLPLLSQYLPLQYRGVIEGRCGSDPDTLVRRSIIAVLEDYASATGS
ncbi:MAG: class II D-tagatose-bisphosphate aldolase, non-catalytic subunit [Spirochaetia bacterium]